MITRSTLFTVPGGDTVQVKQTAAYLENKNIQVSIRLADEKIDYSSFHLIHFFNITRPADIIYHIKKSGKPYVVSTIFVDYAEYDKQHRKGFAGLLFRFIGINSIEYVKTISRWLLGKDKLISKSFLWRGQRKSIEYILQHAELLLPNSYSEFKRLKACYNFNTGYEVVPNAVDTNIFLYNKYVPKDPNLVLCVARIEGIKNQLNLIYALNNTKYRLLIIGNPSPNQMDYYNQCCHIAAKNVEFIPHMTQAELLQYYQRAAVHVLPSWFETTGLSSLEAAAMGCSIVITDKGDTREYFGNDAQYCDPSSPQNIFAAVEKAALLRENESLRNKLISHYSWEKATIKTMAAYKTIKKIWD